MIVDYSKSKNGAKNNVVGVPAEEKPTTQIWINVGYERNGKFVSLPLGIPMDQLQPVKVPGPKTENKEFRFLQQARNNFLETLQKLMGQLAPGEEHILENLQVQIRRVDVKEAVELSAEELEGNPFAFDFSLSNG